MSSKKLTQLVEKVTSLNADDLLYVSTNGESKSIKASTLEAPLKAYADQKKSEVITQIQQVDNKLTTEVSNRQASDQSLATSIGNIEQSLSTEVVNRELGDSSTLSSANAYTDQEINSLSSSLSSSISSVEVPVGVMHLFAGISVPEGYIVCDGSTISRVEYAGLFSVIGESFGSGDGTSTFNLPNPDSNVNLKYIIKF